MHTAHILAPVCVVLAGLGIAGSACQQYTSESSKGDAGETSSGNVTVSSSGSGGSSSGEPGSSSSSGSGGSSASSSSASSSGAPGPELTAWERDVLAGLNEVRANASPVPNPALPPLVWNESLASVLRTWAERCKFEQPPVSTSGKIGAGSPPQSAEEAVVRTTDSNFDYAANTCTSGSCYAHRATLSRDVTSVACAIRDCTGNPPPSGSGAWELWGCAFDPANDPSERPY